MERYLLRRTELLHSWEIIDSRVENAVGVFRRDRDGFYAEHEPNRMRMWSREPFDTLRMVTGTDSLAVEVASDTRMRITKHNIREVLEL